MKSLPYLTLLAVLCAAFPACGVYDQPLAKSVQDKLDELNSIKTIVIDSYPFPNVFDIDDQGPAGWGPREWEEERGLRISGVTGAHEIRMLSPDEYTIESSGGSAMLGDRKFTVRLLDESRGLITREFSVKTINFTPDYYSIEPYGHKNGKTNGKVIPFPSKAKEGETVSLIVNPAPGYILEKSSLTFSGYSTGETGKIDESLLTFKMPGYPIKLEAGFVKAAAVRAGSGGYIYYKELTDAIADSVNSGPIIIISDISVASEIEIAGDIKITVHDTPKEIKRVSGTGCLFNVKTGGGLTLEAASVDGLVINGCSIPADSPIIKVSGGTLTVNNGVTLKDNKNTANSTNGASNGYGGAVFVDAGLFVMNGGVITGNEAGYGGGVYNNASFTMNGSAVVTDDNDVYLAPGERITAGTLTPGAAGYSAKITPASYPQTGGQSSTVYVLDVLSSDPLWNGNAKFTVTPNGNILWAIDSVGVLYWSGMSAASAQGISDALNEIKNAKGNGQFSNGVEAVILLTKSINFPSTPASAADNYSRINISGAGLYPPLHFKADNPVTINAGIDRVLNVMDGNTVTIGKNITLTGGNMSAFGGAGAKVSGAGGKLILDGGVVTGNTAPNGGGVEVTDHAVFEMKSGEIHNNTAVQGGGVFISAGGVFIIDSPAAQIDVHDNGQSNVWGVNPCSFFVNNTLQSGSGKYY